MLEAERWFRTSEVSSPGIASSSTDRFVSERSGSSLVADCGADMMLCICRSCRSCATCVDVWERSGEVVVVL
jgi:hypothetical protein